MFTSLPGRALRPLPFVRPANGHLLPIHQSEMITAHLFGCPGALAARSHPDSLTAETLSRPVLDLPRTLT